MATVEKSGIIKYKNSSGDTTIFYPVADSTPIDMASTDGVTYTCTVPWISKLTVGANFIGVPAIVSTSTAVKLNVNGLGDVLLRRRVSTSSVTTTAGFIDNWLSVGKPVRIMYNGSFWMTDMVKPVANDLMGIVKPENGGTGNSTGYISAGQIGHGGPGTCATAEGKDNNAEGAYSHAEGKETTASDIASHAEGSSTTASAKYSHAEGDQATASGQASHAEGFQTTASASDSHAEGSSTTASGIASHAEGSTTTASNSFSHAEGYRTNASGVASHAEGWRTTTGDGMMQHVSGRYNEVYPAPTAEDDTSGSIFIVGIGTSDDARANALRITTTGDCMGIKSFTSSGADYAEYFEWADKNSDNEDRRGKFVTLDGDKIRIANDTDDYILGVVSACPSVIGDGFTDRWKNMYLTDAFGNEIVEVTEVSESINEETGETIPGYTKTSFIVNPNYDHTQKYIGRELRKEWSPVGLVGKLVVVDDGTCEVNGYCRVSSSGGATKSVERTPYRVMSRIDDTHIRVIIK